MPYGLEKGLSSVVHSLGCIFMLKLGVLSNVCTDLLDGYS